MGQSWREVLFAHWAVDPLVLREVLPPELEVDLRGDWGWIGITPFRVSGLHLRGLPSIPGLSSFPEVNLRTYVKVDGKPGVHFLSLDTNSRAGILGARLAYLLPYYLSKIELEETATEFEFRSERRSQSHPGASLHVRYEPRGEVGPPEPGSLAEWLTERYCLYTVNAKREVLRGDIHHRPWRLAESDATILENTMAEGLGLDLESEPLFHYSPGQDVLLWALEKVASRSSSFIPAALALP